MKKPLIFSVLMSSAVFGLVSCGDVSNTNQILSTNTNRAVSNMGNATMNSNAAINANSANINANRAAVIQDNFWTEAAQGGMAEVELGKLALTKAQNPEVKKFAQMMITDHTKANGELKTLAAKKSVTLPAEVNSDQKSMMDDLNKLSGAEFDKAYVDAMVEDHEKDVELFADQAEDNDDADVKTFAAKTLPTLKSHLEMIKGMDAKMQ